MKTLGEELKFVKKQLEKALMASSREINNRKVQQEVKELRAERDELVEKIEQYGSNYIEGANTSAKQVNRKSRVIISY